MFDPGDPRVGDALLNPYRPAAIVEAEVNNLSFPPDAAQDYEGD